QRIDRSVMAFGDFGEGPVADLAIDRRFRDGDKIALRIPAPLVHDAEALDLEVIRHTAEQTLRQQFETRLGAIISIALELARLHLVEQRIELRMLRIDGNTDIAQP